MDEKSIRQPLLSTNYDQNLKPSFMLSSTKWFLKAAMWVIFIAWASLISLYPSKNLNFVNLRSVSPYENTIFKTSGSVFLLYSAPILLLAFLATAYIYLRGENEFLRKKSSEHPRIRLWTMPILVNGPLGVVSAAEAIAIAVFTAYIVWAIYAENLKNIDILPIFHLPPKKERLFTLQLIGLRFGVVGLFCVALLFLPIARGSSLLRLVGIPFEHATRYHVWLGHLTMLLFTLHALFLVIAWTIEGRLLNQLTEWKMVDVANFPGVISLAAGLLMWVTSLPGVRRRNFEVFFYTHQLYIVFVVFMALHIGCQNFCYVAGGIFLFMLDRLLRFFQSRRKVAVVSARSFPCGTLELVLAKPPNLHYNALGWIFLQIRELSWLQWHPFSVSSSPLDGKHHVAVLIKVLGDWTEKLERRISQMGVGAEKELTASVEGPYGHESPYHLMYENLILVAGGIGITPFLAILSDILHRINEGRPCLPKNVVIIWAVKQSDELPLLQTVDMESICPNFSASLNLEIQTYVTRQSQPSLEEGRASIEPLNSAAIPACKQSCGISVLVGTGNILWSGIYVMASTLGLVITAALLNNFYIIPYNVYYSWYQGFLLVVCMIVSVVVFGGFVIVLWHSWERKGWLVENIDEAAKIENASKTEVRVSKSFGKEECVNTIRYGERPDFGGIFGSIEDQWGSVDIGVIVCGPSTLETSVAKECRARNLSRGDSHPVFHFNSHSFDL